MERKSCCSGSRCVSTTARVTTTATKMPKNEDVKPFQSAVKKEEDVKPFHEATAAAVVAKGGVKSEAAETITVKKEEEPVKVNAGCGGGGGCVSFK